VTPVRCPVSTPGIPVVDGPLDALLARLADPAPVHGTLTFPRGTVQPDGRLDLCKQSLSPPEVRRVLAAAVTSAHPRHLLLGTNGLGAAGIAALVAALPPGHRVETLYLGCNLIDADGVAPLAGRIADDGTVRALWLKRNPIGDDGLRRVADALRANTTVRVLDLTNTGITGAGLRVLAGALRDRGVPLERLYLGGNAFGPADAETMAGLLRDVGLTGLHTDAGRLGDAGAATLAAALGEVTGRRVELGLGGNGIGVPGVRALAARLDRLDALDLARPPSARVLLAEPNEVGDEGAAALAAALPGSGLRRLDLRHTGVTGRGARLLVAAAAASGTLQELGLGSGVPRRMKRAVAATLAPVSAPPPHVRVITSVYR
jgi:hypothetical protein